jgi:hypothetical protein
MDDGKPCICNAEGDDRCALLTRLTVALPELTTMLGWRLETKGDNAARELLASMDLVQGVASGRPFVPAKLRIVERRGNVNGQAVRYVVPVIDVALPYAALLGGELTPSRDQAALPAGYTPIVKTEGNGASLADGLREAETQTLAKPPRVPLAEDDEILDEPGAEPSPRAALAAQGAGGPGTEPAPSAPVESGASSLPAASVDADTGGAPASHKPTPGQRKKLGILVKTLRDEQSAISTENLWAALANARNVDVEAMIALLEGRDAEGVLHFGPLLADLSRGEASNLIDRLERLAQTVGAAA